MDDRINLKNIDRIKDDKITYFLNNYFHKIYKYFQPQEIWFWGSRIYGSVHPHSDIDILLVSDIFSNIRVIKRRSHFLKTIGKLKDKNLPIIDAFCLTPDEFIEKKAEDGFLKDLFERGVRVL